MSAYWKNWRKESTTTSPGHSEQGLPLINYNVVSKGKVLYSESEEVEASVEARAVDKFLDRKHYEERHADHRLEKISREGLS